jgi:hypothetical protein
LQWHKGVVGQGICGGVFFSFLWTLGNAKTVTTKGENKGIPNGQQGL